MVVSIAVQPIRERKIKKLNYVIFSLAAIVVLADLVMAGRILHTRFKTNINLNGKTTERLISPKTAADQVAADFDTYEHGGYKYINGEIKEINMDSRKLVMVSGSTQKTLIISQYAVFAKGDPGIGISVIREEEVNNLNLAEYQNVTVRLNSANQANQIVFFKEI